ncbi:hypothetical protein EYF80_001401 [Liparis tanakae]|uniref:Uncharacterized protein n=1 Tax=Liparis tanakae TaxID=230148 RepID=A0A4Z2JD07_9TELE|nr:hypothetical protein EYF80_001401 [Liparis tanakae]
MSFSGTSTWLTADPWCWGGKPTGDGQRLVTLEPNVGPPGTQHLEGRQPSPEEELMNSLGQILARIEEVGRAQAEDRRLFFEARLGPPAWRLNPVPQCPAVPTFEPSEVRIPEVQEPVELPATPVSRGPSAEVRPWFPVTRRRLLIPGARRRGPLPLPVSIPVRPCSLSPCPGQSPLPFPQIPHVTFPQSPLLLCPVPRAPPPVPGPGSPEPSPGQALVGGRGGVG